MTRGLAVVGINHRTAPVEIRERFVEVDGRIDGLCERMLALAGVEEAVIVSTCNRVEVVASCDDPTDTSLRIAGALLDGAGLDGDRSDEFLYEHHGREAVRHVFRVAASLDSMVVGEPQILGQLKEQFERAVENDTTGAILHRVFHKSFSVAKRVRTETSIAARAVSVASAAVDLAASIFERLDDCTVTLIGAGETGETAARHLINAGVSDLMVANRTFETAVTLAGELKGTPIPIERLGSYLPLADLVIGAAGGGQIVSVEKAREILHERSNRPVFFIDLAVPRNFDAGINELNNAYLYDIDDLAAVVAGNLDERQREAVRGEAIVDGEVDSFWLWFESLDVVPTIVELRDRAESIRREELERTLLRMPDVANEDRERIDQMTRAIVNKLLHRPTAELRSRGSDREGSRLLTAVRRLFGLGEES